MNYAMYEALLLKAKDSPLNALRTLHLTGCQLERLSIFLRRLDQHGVADLIDAEAALQKMLERRRNLWLN